MPGRLPELWPSSREVLGVKPEMPLTCSKCRATYSAPCMIGVDKVSGRAFCVDCMPPKGGT